MHIEKPTDLSLHILKIAKLKGSIFNKLFILRIKCETLDMNSLTCLGSNEKWCPKFFINFDIVMTSLMATVHQNFKTSETHK